MYISYVLVRRQVLIRREERDAALIAALETLAQPETAAVRHSGSPQALQ